MDVENVKELISIIVPVYKVEEYLDRCVQSIINQTYKNLEIMLVDDGSPDNCPNKCDNWARVDSRIKVIHKANGGISDARNAGMKAATGDYISFIDSDDWIHEQFYEILLDIMHNSNADIAGCKIKTAYEYGEDSKISHYNVKEYNVHEAMKAVIEEKIPVPVWCKIYKREVIQNELFDVGKCHEDVFWTYRAYGNCRKAVAVDAEMYYYFQRKGSIMGEAFSEKRLDALEAMEKRCRYIEKKVPELSDLALIKYMELCMYQYQTVCRDKPLDIADEIKMKIIGRVKSEKHRFRELRQLSVKERMWMRLFSMLPDLTCRARNKLRIGV